MGTPHYPKLQSYWSLTIRLFNIISRKLFGGFLPDWAWDKKVGFTHVSWSIHNEIIFLWVESRIWINELIFLPGMFKNSKDKVWKKEKKTLWKITLKCFARGHYDRLLTKNMIFPTVFSILSGRFTGDLSSIGGNKSKKTGNKIKCIVLQLVHWKSRWTLIICAPVTSPIMFT